MVFVVKKSAVENDLVWQFQAACSVHVQGTPSRPSESSVLWLNGVRRTSNHTLKLLVKLWRYACVTTALQYILESGEVYVWKVSKSQCAVMYYEDTGFSHCCQFPPNFDILHRSGNLALLFYWLVLNKRIPRLATSLGKVNVEGYNTIRRM